jgi:hypothetical protein
MALTPDPRGPQGGDALTGSGEGSDTQAASAQGGSRSGGERCDEDLRNRRARNEVSAATLHEGAREAAAAPDRDAVNNTGVSGFDRDKGPPASEGDDVDAASS